MSPHLEYIKNTIFRIIKITFWIILIFILISVINYFYISYFSSKYLFDNIKESPYNKVALVLGTSPLTIHGQDNPYFINRMILAKEILDNKKADYLIVSGDNRDISYNEPKYMRNYLIKIGVSSSSIISDYAGRRTLDSILRSEKIFDQYSITIISQKFHNERAIYIARKNNIDAIAINADYPYKFLSKDMYSYIKNYIREILARDLATIDILTGREAEILGNQILIK